MARDMLFGERRLYERKYCAFDVGINDFDRNYGGLLRNLSLGGALVEPPIYIKPRIGQELLLTIAYRLKAGLVVVSGKVVHLRPDGMAVAFQKR